MKITTSRFGEMEVEKQSIIRAPGGLIGFPDQQKFVLIRHNPDSPFYWLQAIDSPDLAFVLVDPLIFKPDYRFPIPKGVKEILKAKSDKDIGVFVIVTIPQGQPEGMTANLLGPVLINTQARLAKQLVLDENKYSHRHLIMSGADESAQTKNQAK